MVSDQGDSFPTRRSTDLDPDDDPTVPPEPSEPEEPPAPELLGWGPNADHWRAADRKSTRLNSSHVAISYAVFCLKKKKKEKGEALIGFIVYEERCVLRGL